MIKVLFYNIPSESSWSGDVSIKSHYLGEESEDDQFKQSCLTQSMSFGTVIFFSLFVFISLIKI